METYKGLKSVVEMFGACSLPGCTIKFDSFMTCLQRAQSRGYVKDHEGDYVADGLRNGFKLGVDFDVLRRNPCGAAGGVVANECMYVYMYI